MGLYHADKDADPGLNKTEGQVSRVYFDISISHLSPAQGIIVCTWKGAGYVQRKMKMQGCNVQCCNSHAKRQNKL